MTHFNVALRLAFSSVTQSATGRPSTSCTPLVRLAVGLGAAGAPCRVARRRACGEGAESDRGAERGDPAEEGPPVHGPMVRGSALAAVARPGQWRPVSVSCAAVTSASGGDPHLRGRARAGPGGARLGVISRTGAAAVLVTDLCGRVRGPAPRRRCRGRRQLRRGDRRPRGSGDQPRPRVVVRLVALLRLVLDDRRTYLRPGGTGPRRVHGPLERRPVPHRDGGRRALGFPRHRTPPRGGRDRRGRDRPRVARAAEQSTVALLPRRALPRRDGAALPRGVHGTSVATGFGAGFIVAAVAFAAGLLGDLQMLELGVLPALGAARRRRCGGARPARPRLLRLVAPLLGVLLAIVARAVAASRSAPSRSPAPTPSRPAIEILANGRHLLSFGAALAGLDAGPFGATGVPGPLLALHVVGAVVVVAASLAALAGLAARLVRPADGADGPSAWRLEDVLGLALLGDLAAFVVLPITPSDAYARYLTGALVFGSVLGALAVGRTVRSAGSLRVEGQSVPHRTARVRLFGVGSRSSLRARQRRVRQRGCPRSSPPTGLTLGVGDYWSSSILSVQSGGSVLVRPVVARQQVASSATTSSPPPAGTAPRFQFYVYDAGPILGRRRSARSRSRPSAALRAPTCSAATACSSGRTRSPSPRRDRPAPRPGAGGGWGLDSRSSSTITGA